MRSIDVSWSKASHTLKFGFEIKCLFLNQGTSNSGTVTFTSTGNFLNNQVGMAAYSPLLPLVRQRRNMYWLYADGEWKVTPNLTINAGIRYNIFNALHALNNQAVPFDFATCGGFCPNTYSYFNPRFDDIDPRIGIAWSHRNTVVRVGGGHLSYGRAG
jgi:outer membrane receptor protein involved in Fe transport